MSTSRASVSGTGSSRHGGHHSRSGLSSLTHRADDEPAQDFGSSISISDDGSDEEIVGNRACKSDSAFSVMLSIMPVLIVAKPC
jgi:hypothetical protein